MEINPADDEINIFLPIMFLIFVGIGLIIFGAIVGFIYVALKKLKLAERKVLDRIAEQRLPSK